jgi:hypothetical protein
MNSLPRWFGRKREKQQQKQQQPQQLKAKQRPYNHRPIYAFDEQSYRRWCHSLLHFFQIDNYTALLSCLFELSYFDQCIAGILILSRTLLYFETRCLKSRTKYSSKKRKPIYESLFWFGKYCWIWIRGSVIMCYGSISGRPINYGSTGSGSTTLIEMRIRHLTFILEFPTTKYTVYQG